MSLARAYSYRITPPTALEPRHRQQNAAAASAKDPHPAAHDAPVEEMTTGSGLSRRTLERRFRKATGRSRISYVQQLRIREARRLLARTTMPIDEIGFVVGYENTAFFRRLF